MTPPDNAPAITRNADEDAAKVISRLVDSHLWVTEQANFLPAIPVTATPSTREPFMEELAAFWQAPVAPLPGQRPVIRVRAIAGRWAALMADAATLGVADGSLGESAKHAVLAFTGAQGHVLPAHVSIRELMVGALPYAGAVVITDGRNDGSALLFMPDRGWESFRDIDALHAEVEERLREMLAGGASLPGLSNDDLVTVGDIAVTSRDIVGNALDALMANIVAVQRRKVAEAWAWRDEGEGHSPRLGDRLDDALALRHYLDAAAMLHRRQIRVLAATQEPRLAQLPDSVRQNWEQALAEYGTVAASTGGTLAVEGFGSIASITGFARDELGLRLRSLGIADDPADIAIELFTTTANTTYGYSGTDVERRPLLDLARDNLGFLDMRGVQAKTSTGRLLVGLRRDDIVAMIRELDLRNAYQRYLMRQLKTSGQGQRVRAASAQLQQARMRFELEDARSTAYVDGEANDFIDDHAERGYRWVEAVLDAPEAEGRQRVEGHDIVVSHLVYEGARLRDVLAIGVREQGSVHRMILYTPDAPDGRNFREFADRQAAAAGFIGNPSFEQYLLERLPAEWSTVGSDGVTRRFRVSDATRRAVWSLSGESGERPFTMTEGRFAEEEIVGNIFNASYDVALGQLMHDAADLARSTGEADYDRAKSLGMLSARFAEGFLPVRLGVAVASVRALHAAWRGIENVERDQRLDAFEDFVDAFSTVGDLAASHVVARSFRRTVLTRVPGQPRRLAATAVTTPGFDAIFDARHIAPGVRLRDARSVRDGIYEIGGNPYIEHDGRAYRVRFDRDNDTWRLMRPGRASTGYAVPIVRDATGAWRPNRNVGLRGGAPERPDLYDREPAELLIEYRGLQPETATLSQSDVEVLVRTLARNGLGAAASKRLIYDRTHGRPTSSAMARHWDAALDDVRRPPPRIPTPPSPAARTFELVKLERSRWPETVWHYTTPYRHSMFTGRALTLSQSLPSSTGPSGLHVTTLDPTHPSRQIVEVMRGTSRTHTFTDDQVRNIAGAYVEIDLARLRDRQRADGTYEFNVYTVAGRSGMEFVIKPTLPAPEVGRAPLSPRHQRELAGIALQPGDFRTGIRIP